MDEPGSVLVVDDDAGIREALTMLLEGAGLTVRAYAGGREFLAAPQPDGPACLLLDLRMPDTDGLDVQRQLHAAGSDIPIIFLSAHADVPLAVEALQLGAKDFFEKPHFDVRKLQQRIREALTQHREHLDHRKREEDVRQQVARLSPREHEVARLAAAGKANKVIAAELGISERTVEVHRGRAMRKLGLRSIADLARAAACL